MQCPRCQARTPEDARFCEECGARLEATCPACGAPVGIGKKFCRGCGAPLGAAAPGPQPAPEAYTPKHLAERILGSKGALEGERKQVTVLFADLKGSMELLADRDPEEARRFLDPVLEPMMEAVHRYEGTVNQVMGDGIMALFGAPLAHEDHAVRACYAALRMQEAVQRYAEILRRTEGVSIQIRVGLNSGEVVVRSIGSDLRMDYTAVGQTTHLAARMEQMAMPGTTLLSASTLRLAEGYVEVKPLGPLPVKGLDAPVEVFELLAAAAARSRLQAAAARGLTRFVGRQSEVEQLGRAQEGARAGHGQVVAVVGEAGVGKSRLFHEFVHSHRTQGWRTLESGSVSYGRATTYLPLLELLRTYFTLERRDDARTIRSKVTGAVLTLDEALRDVIAPVLSLLEALPADDPFARLDPPQRRQRTLDGLKRLLLRESQAQPLLLVFEDLHWIDSETQALLDALVDSVPTAQILLLVNYRPEYSHGWGGRTYYTQIRIDPLQAESADELLGALLGDAPELDPLRRLLVQRTEGNPFFLEESVQTLVETGVLVGERGAYRAGKAPRGVEVPPTVQAVLAVRIDRLEPRDKLLLQSAAVIGKEVPLAPLQAIADLTTEELHRGLSRLQAAEFIYEARLFPDLEYTFKHALTHEVTYQSILQARRRELHARIGAAIETLHADRPEEWSEELARHYERGEVWDKAAHFGRMAGDRAAALCADAKSVEHYERALAALGRVPETAGTARLGIDLRLAARAPLWRAGQLDRLDALFREAEALATRHAITEPLDRIYAFFVPYYWARGDYDQALSYGRRALDTARERNDLGLTVSTTFYIAHAHQSRGELREAIRQSGRLMALLEGGRETERFGLSGLPYSSSAAYVAECSMMLGDFPAALAALERGERVAGAARHLYSETVLAITRARALTHHGRLGEAIARLEELTALCRERQFLGQGMIALMCLAQAYALAGRAPEGIPLVEQAIGFQESVKAHSARAMMLGLLAELQLRAGGLDRVEATVENALGFARRHHERGSESWALWVLGAAAHAHGAHDRAAIHLETARAISEELGLRLITAHGQLLAGEVCAPTGRPAEARPHLEAAAALFRAMGLTFWAERAEAARAALG